MIPSSLNFNAGQQSAKTGDFGSSAEFGNFSYSTSSPLTAIVIAVAVVGAFYVFSSRR